MVKASQAGKPLDEGPKTKDASELRELQQLPENWDFYKSYIVYIYIYYLTCIVYTYLPIFVKLAANNYSNFVDACTVNLHSLCHEFISLPNIFKLNM